MKAIIFLVSLTLLVVTHELGHLLFAKLFHTRVRRFYVFFNSKTPESWEEANLRPEDQNNTLWGLGWIPLGGYCDIAGMVDETKGADDLEKEPQPWEYRTKPGWQRLCIISGGVLVNFISALIIYGAIFSHWGKDELPLRNATLGYEYHQVLLDQGFQNGDIIYAIDGEEQFDFTAATKKLILDKPRTATLLRGDSLVTITFSPDLLSTIVNENPKHLMTPRIPFVVKDFSAGSLGKRCGIQIGDSLVSINGILTPSSTDLTKALSSCAGEESHLLLGSDGKLGIYAVSDMSRFFKVNHIDYTLLQAIPAGISYGWETLVTYVSSLKILFTKDGAKNLGGFITIATLFPDHWDWLAFWNLTALLAVVLAFMNIIPIPGLDGGHIVITLWEMITRKPVNEKALNVIQNIGMIILLLLLVIANGNDLIKVFNQLMQ